MFSLLKNNFYRLHKWLDDRELLKFLFLLISVGIPNIMLFLGSSNPFSFYVGFVAIVISLPIWLTRINYISGKWIFDGSRYKIPEVGDVLVIKKNFWWDGGFRKIKPNTRSSNVIESGEEWRITVIMPGDCDWKIYLKSDRGDIVISYFKSIGYWKTKSDIRNESLKRIGI